MYYIGLDIHKKTISYCIKEGAGTVIGEGSIASTREALDEWMQQLRHPWTAAMEATMFTGWIYDYLKPHAAAVKVAHPLMLRAIAASKKKNDHIDARKIADCLRCDFLPECYMAPTGFRERRRILRYRHLLVRQAVQLKNKAAGLLMETGVTYNKEKLHQARYFTDLLAHNEEISEGLRPLLKINRELLVRAEKIEAQLLRTLERDPQLSERVKRLMTIPGVGPVTALSWVLEIGEVERMGCIKEAISYCGLCGAEVNSAGIAKRTPLSKQRNRHLQHVLVEAAKLAPRFNPDLAVVHAKEIEKGNRNRATLAVARKLVAYLLAVDREKRNYRAVPDPQGKASAAA
jgi:transposase